LEYRLSSSSTSSSLNAVNVDGVRGAGSLSTTIASMAETERLLRRREDELAVCRDAQLALERRLETEQTRYHERLATLVADVARADDLARQVIVMIVLEQISFSFLETTAARAIGRGAVARSVRCAAPPSRSVSRAGLNETTTMTTSLSTVHFWLF
jgi:hypothetical protein